jgi:hypothetical protein
LIRNAGPFNDFLVHQSSSRNAHPQIILIRADAVRELGAARDIGMNTQKQAPFRQHTTLRSRASSFWSTDRSLTVFLVLLVVNIFSSPLTEFATWGRFAARSIFSLIIISGVIAAVRDRRIVALAVVLTLGSLFVEWEGLERANPYLNLFNDFCSLLFLGFLIVLILRQVLRAGPITARRVQGSVSVYLLFGILWAVCYEIVEFWRPGSFGVLGKKGQATLPQLAYFSFTTLTTLGLGEIIPLSPLARSFVVLEALVGQLFPVVLIARLVAMQIEYHKGTNPND